VIHHLQTRQKRPPRWFIPPGRFCCFRKRKATACAWSIFSARRTGGPARCARPRSRYAGSNVYRRLWCPPAGCSTRKTRFQSVGRNASRARAYPNGHSRSSTRKAVFDPRSDGSRSECELGSASPDFSQRRPWLSGAPVHVKFSAAGPKKDVHFCNVYYAEVRTGRPRADQRTANTMSALR